MILAEFKPVLVCWSVFCLLTAGCDAPKQKESEPAEERIAIAEQQVLMERERRQAAEHQAEHERQAAGRARSVAVLGLGGSVVALVIGGVAGIAMATRAQSAVRQHDQEVGHDDA